jgi:hypothetical protein
MNEQQALSKMVAPGQKRQGIWRGGVIQVWVTRACDKACFACTQGSNLGGKPHMITVEQFEQALLSLKGYFGVTGIFGGNPSTHPQFEELCRLVKLHIPREQRGIWCNNPISLKNAAIMRETFNPAVSNLNVHMDKQAYDLFSKGWPECRPFLKGLDTDSRHAPPYVAMRDVLKKTCERCKGTGDEPYDNPHTGQVEYGPNNLCQNCDDCLGNGWIYDESKAWELISDCDINKHWSAMIGVFRGQLRAWFCEIAGAQSMLHQDEPDYPDTGVDITKGAPYWHQNIDYSHWWKLPMRYSAFTAQVRKHCHDCGIPLRAYGELAMGGEVEQVSQTHLGVYKPKRKDRRVELVVMQSQLGKEPSRTVTRSTDYLENSGI